MARYKTEIEGPDGWSEWKAPHMEDEGGYRMACCDCGLVHDIAFKVDEHKGRPAVIMRARRNNRATAQKRRHKENKQ